MTQAEHPDGVEEAELLVENIIWNPELSGVSVEGDSMLKSSIKIK